MAEGLSQSSSGGATTLEKFWRILLYGTDDAVAKFDVTSVKSNRGNWSKISSHRATVIF